MRTRILIVDDHTVVRDGLAMIIEASADLEVAGTAADGREAIIRANELKPDVIIMDIAMPNLNGIEATAALRVSLPLVRTIILSMHNTREHVYRAMQAGAAGFVLKESAGTEVLTAVRAVASGGVYFGNGVEIPESRTSPTPPSKSPLDRLSSREREVLQLVVEGMTSSSIAGILTLSPKSVETYRSRIMRKLGLSDITSLVKFAVHHGITPPA